MPTQSTPVFWRDPRMPHVELRKVEDGRQVSYGLHSHAHWSLGAITGGESTYRYRDRSFHVKTGDLVLMNPHWAHACNPIENEPWAYLMMYVDTQWLTQLRYDAALLEEPEWRDIATATLTDSTLYQRYCEVADCLLNPGRDLLDKQTGLVELLFQVMHAVHDQPTTELVPVPGPLKRVAAYLDRHAADDVSLETLCNISGYSPGHLIRSFKQHFDLTPHAYLVNRRVQLGQGELKRGTPIADAALNAGFADQPHFQRVFKRLLAATPKQYRTLDH